MRLACSGLLVGQSEHALNSRLHALYKDDEHMSTADSADETSSSSNMRTSHTYRISAFPKVFDPSSGARQLPRKATAKTLAKNWNREGVLSHLNNPAQVTSLALALPPSTST